MCEAEVTAISLVTNKSRDEICNSVIPYVARALSNQRVDYQRLPLTRDYIDWVINETDQLTIALEETGNACVILVAARGADTELSAARMANVAAELCRDYAAHTVFWNGSDTPIDARDFLMGDRPADVANTDVMPVVPRRIRAPEAAFRARGEGVASFRHLSSVDLRELILTMDEEDVLEWELEARRAKSAPLRLSAWAMSLTTALFATPLAIPIIVHNLVRGEDLRAGAMSLGVAGLYATMAQTGLVPGLAAFL